MANRKQKFYAPVKWEDRLWMLLDGHVDSLRLNLEKLDMNAAQAVTNCRSALKRMHRNYNIRVEPDAIVVFR